MVSDSKNEIVSSQPISLAEALWIVGPSRQWDALAYDKVSVRPSTVPTTVALAQDRARALPGETRVVLRTWREGTDERPLDADGHRIGADPRPVKQEIEWLPDEQGRLPLSGNRESLPHETKRKEPRATVAVPFEDKHFSFLFSQGAHGEPHPVLNPREWTERNSMDGVLVPTARQDGIGARWCRTCDTSVKTCTCKLATGRPKVDNGFRFKKGETK